MNSCSESRLDVLEREMLLAPDRTEPGADPDGVAALALGLEVAVHMFLPLVPSPSGTAEPRGLRRPTLIAQGGRPLSTVSARATITARPGVTANRGG